MQTAAFPAPSPAAWLDTPGLEACGLCLRPATDSDLPFLRELYAESRAPELTHVPWPRAARQAFCDSQFALQHRHYVDHCPAAAFLLVLQADRPVGRLYVHLAAGEMRIVDLLLAATVRGHGLGTALLQWLQAAACGVAADRLSLHVLRHNQGARRLYQRLGFIEEATRGDHLRMAWQPGDTPGVFTTCRSSVPV